MLALIGCEEFLVTKKISRAIRELREKGFSVQQCPLPALVSQIELISLAGGRVDVVALVGVPSSLEPIATCLRSLPEHLLFKGGTRARTTPIVVLNATILSNLPLALMSPSQFVVEELVGKALYEMRWTTVIEDADAPIAETVVSAIQTWREALLEELDFAGFAVSMDATGRISLSTALQRKRRQTEILADEGSPASLRRGQYLLIGDDVLQEIGVLDEFKFLLQNYTAIATKERIKPETVFQRFFEKHPHLVKRGLFDRAFPKPKLRIAERQGEYYTPDFVLKPTIGCQIGGRWEIMDLKLPSDPLVTSRRFHPKLAAKLTHAMRQLRDYRDYFNRPDKETREELIRRFGGQPLHPRLAVLIGRAENADDIERIQGADNDVQIITYDDVIEFEQNRIVLESRLSGLF